MFCPNCGTQANGKFCPNCGMPLASQPTPAAPVNNGYAAPYNGYAQNPAPQAPNSYASPYADTRGMPNANSYPPNGYAAPYGAPGNYNQNQQFNNQQVVVNVNAGRPVTVGHLRTDRALWKLILFSMLTLGIYGLVVMCHVSDDINTIATRYDNRRTMHYALMTFLIAPITLGIGGIVWEHRICSRFGDELNRRGIGYSFSASTFWLWGVLGSLILVGPFIFMHKFFRSINLLAADYNING